MYLFLRFPGGKLKAVTASYDDGTRTDIMLADILNKYGLKCTFNVNSGRIGVDTTDKRLTISELKHHILDAGHEIAVHGHLHWGLGAHRPIEGIRDVLQCRLQLEEAFGGIIRGMAYADRGITDFQNGMDYEKIKSYLKNLDIAYARTLGGDNDRFELPTDWYAWMPTVHHNNPKALEYAKVFTSLAPTAYAADNFPRLFYFWGHSVEFQKDHNWERLEEICKILSNQEDTWYATNMEIFLYVQAYNSLVFSADSTVVYNPTLLDIWFAVDQQVYKIAPGETLELDRNLARFR